MKKIDMNYLFSSKRRAYLRALSTLVAGLLVIFMAQAQNDFPTVEVRFANPAFDCHTQAYCLDVEFRGDQPDLEVFGMNVRFLYNPELMTFDAITNFAGGYGPVSPNPPLMTVSAPGIGYSWFGFGEPGTGIATFINGSVQLVDQMQPEILLDTEEWTYLYQVCFTLLDSGDENFCPPVVWDLNQAQGMEDRTGYFIGDDGVVITIVDPNNPEGSLPTVEDVVNFNWQYLGSGDEPPYGEPIAETCITTNCAPIITCPDVLFVDCNDSVDPEDLESMPTVENICEGDLGFTFTDSIVTTNQICPTISTIYRTWIVFNTCELADTCVQIIEIQDLTAPEIICAADTLLGCDAYNFECDAAGFVNCFAPDNWTATENSGSITITEEEAILISGNASETDTTTLCIVSPGNGTILFNWSYITPDPEGPAWDRFGYSIDGVFTELTNLEQFMQFGHIAVTVAEGEEFCFVQLTSDGDFGAATTINASFIFSQVGVPEISDDCSLVSLTFADAISDDSCTGNFVITRLWTVSDACGLTSTCEQIITVQDTVAPSMQCPTSEILVACFSEIPSPDTTIPDIITEDNCSSVEVVHVSDVVVDSTCQNQMTIVRTFMASDECGNTATCTQTISVFDNIPPTITCPTDITVTCASDVPAADPGLVTVEEDNCGDVVVSHLSDEVVDFVCANNHRILRTYMATDGCGNSTACIQQIIVLDTQAPTITCPAPVTVTCAADIPAPNTGLVTSSDNCGGAVTVAFLNDVTNQGACPNQFTVTRTYQATDACGNTATCTQLITVNDQTPPVITCPADLTIDFGDSEDPAATGTPTGTDNCGGALTFDFVDEIIPGACDSSYTIVRIWSAFDACNNSAICTQTILVNPSCFDPCLPICPGDIEVTLLPGQCEAYIHYTIGTTGDCVVDGTLEGFLPEGTWEFGNTPSNTGGTFNGAGLPSTVVLVSGDSGVGNGVTWYQTTVTTTATITFDWTYTTLDGPNFDRLGYVLNGTFFVLTNNAGALNQSGSASVPVNAGDVFGVAMFTLDGVFGPATGTFTNLVIPSQLVSVVEIVSGPASGSGLEAGTYTVEACIEDVVLGGINCCSFNITVNPYIVTDFTMVCNDHVNISVDGNCEVFVGTDMVLEGGHYGCYDDYLVSVEGYGSGFGGVLLGSDAVGKTLVVTVTDPETGNSCWGTILIEDKIPPVISCNDFSVFCGEEIPEIPAPSFEGAVWVIGDTVNYFQGNSLSCGAFCGGGTPNSFFQVYTGPGVNAQASRAVVALDNQCNAGAGTVVATIYTLNNTAQPYNVSAANRTFIGQSAPFAIPPGSEGQKVYIPFPAGIEIPGNSTILLRIDIDQEYLLVDCPGNGSLTWLASEPCGISPDDPQLYNSVGNFPQEKFMFLYLEAEGTPPYDNCGEIDLTYTDERSGNTCDGEVILRTWLVTDASGNTASCVQTITILPLQIEEVEFPGAYFGDCDDDPHPSHTGWPVVNGVTLTNASKLCNIFLDYWDQVYNNNCGGSYKIVRTWTIVDWCVSEVYEGIQILVFEDGSGPVINNGQPLADLTVGTDFWYCHANINLPRPIAVDACGSGPITWNLSATNGVIVQFGNNYRLDQVPVGTTIVTWTATDACGNSSSATQTIIVVDDVAPVAICDHHTIVTLTNDGPNGVTLIPAEVFDDGSYDNCGPVTLQVRRMDNPGGRCAPAGTSGQIPNWTTNGACIDDIAQQGNPTAPDFGTVFRPCVPFFCCDVAAPGTTNPITVVLQVTDGSGNVNECMVIAEVQDKIPPFVITPPDIIVSCDFWFHYAEGIFNDDVAANPPGNGDGSLDEDPLSGIFGNIYDAFRYDESIRQPIIINDPGNPSLPQPYNWGLDGWANDNCEVYLRVQVVVTDGCNKATQLPAGAPNNAIKLIERRFQVRDAQGNQPPGAVRQRIWVVDYDPFTITDTQCGLINQDDVRWPCDLILTDCPEGGLTPENLEGMFQPNSQNWLNARPRLNEDNCNLLAVTYEDTRFDFAEGTCYKILREWTVVDWCQFDLQAGTGIWKYTQVISVIDNNPPQFIEPAQTEVLCVNQTEGVTLPDNNQIYLGEGNPNASSCSAHLHLKKRVRETCSNIVQYDVKLYPFNGSEYVLLKQGTATVDPETSEAELYFNTRENTTPILYRQNGIPYNSPWCNDYHKLLWTVMDGCGRENTLEYLIRLEDCKAPSPVCINGLSTVVMEKNGEVTIWAKDFNASSFDDCTPGSELLFSFSGDTYQPSFTYTCDNIPAFNVEIQVQIWVADGGTDDNCNGQISWNERNKDFCTTTIVISDNHDVCDQDGSILAGEVITSQLQTVEKVDVNLTSPGHYFPSYLTVSNGHYVFNNVPFGQDYTIRPERNDQHKNGVNTLDLVAIQRHLLGIEQFTTPFQFIAADADNSKSVSAIDLVEIRRLILGIYNQFPNNKSWRFVDGRDELVTNHPWPFSEEINLADLAVDSLMHLDFTAVKIGDVNHTAVASSRQVQPRDARRTIDITASSVAVVAGEWIEVTLTIPESLVGFQWTLEAPGFAFAGVKSDDVKIGEEHIGLPVDGVVTMSWNHEAGVAVEKDGNWSITLMWQALTAGQLKDMISMTSDITEAEAYTAEGEILNVQLRFDGEGGSADFALFQNQPNPWEGQTSIGFNLPSAGDVTLTVFDATGREVVKVKGEYGAGYNSVILYEKDLPATGVLYYRLESGEYSATKKMILVK